MDQAPNLLSAGERLAGPQANRLGLRATHTSGATPTAQQPAQNTVPDVFSFPYDLSRYVLLVTTLGFPA